jgi:hypothetical protein
MRTLTKIAPSAKPNRRSFASLLIMLNPHHYCFSLKTKASAAIVLWGAPRIGVEHFNAILCSDRSDRS